ncbi:DUF4166 domain-containing protein [Kitasatospora viridis]|uniref:DUF4166 domain-containing protein n=1 Tax=Kitasatospora viridis TaxID=281105 RepID=UPI001FEA2BBE|nr:DUF4166 domain-containing protein [Kitasatospora viridis]
MFRRALGPAFERLHPQLQRRFGFSSRSGVACLGTGRMDQVWHGSPALRPFLRFGATRNLLFPEQGRDIDFTIANYAYLDRFGRETVTFVRTFQFARPRRFDATMIASDRDPRLVVDFLGTHQHIAADLRFRVTRPGGLLITTHGQRFTGLPGAPGCPSALTGHARVHEWYDDRADRFRIDVQVTNPLIGPVLGYSGSFRAEYVEVTDPAAIPGYVRPVRECPRS